MAVNKIFLKNTFWQSGGNISAQIINILSFPIITRTFTPADVGYMNLFIELLALITILISFRIEQLIILPKNNSEANNLYGFVFTWGLLCSAFLTILIICLFALKFIQSEYIAWVLILPFTAFILALSNAAQALSQRSANFKLSGISEIVNRSSYSVIAILSGVFGASGFMLGVSVALGYLFKLLTFFRYINFHLRYFFTTFSIGLRQIKNLKFEKLIGSIIFSNFILSLTGIAPLWLIASRYGADNLGYFTIVASTLGLMTRIVGNAVGQVFYQAASKELQNGNNFNGLFMSNLKILIIISFPIFSIIFLYGPEIYSFIFGENWIYAGLIAQIYVFPAWAWFLCTPFERSSLIVNAWWYGPIFQTIRLFLFLILIFIAFFYDMPFLIFIILLSIVSVITSISDCIASYTFSQKAKFY